MLVIGGRSAWLRAASGAIASGLCAALATASCGGRTSTLDSEAYGFPSDHQDGGSGGSSAGRGGAGRGGTAAGRGGTATTAGSGGVQPTGGSMSTGGKPMGTGGLDPSLAVAPCTKYCPGYGTECRELLGNQDCVSACETEMNGYGKTCQSLGIKTLSCLTPFFTPNGADCNGAVQKALTQCGKLVKQFEACKSKASGQEQPATPPPAKLDPTSCPRMSQADATFCTTRYECGNDAYVVTCKTDSASSQNTCSCSTPAGVYSLPVDPGSLDGNPCPLAASLCFALAVP